jgi:hypothetical protein
VTKIEVKASNVFLFYGLRTWLALYGKISLVAKLLNRDGKASLHSASNIKVKMD